MTIPFILLSSRHLALPNTRIKSLIISKCYIGSAKVKNAVEII